MLRKIFDYYLKHKMNKIIKSVTGLINYTNYLESSRVYITDVDKKEFIDAFNCIYKEIRKDKIKRRIDKDINLKFIWIFFEKYKNFDKDCDKLNNIIKENEKKAKLFLDSLNELRKTPELDNLYALLVDEYKDVNEYLSNDVKMLGTFNNFRRYYLNLENFKLIWIEIKKNYNCILKFNKEIKYNDGDNYFFLEKIKHNYDEVYDYCKQNFHKSECIWDIYIIKDFINYYRKIESIIKRKNHVYLNNEFSELLNNLGQDNRLIIVKKINDLILYKNIPPQDIKEYFNGKISNSKDIFENEVAKVLKRRYGNEIKILQNVYIPTKQKDVPFTQIDLILFIRGNIYVLELKDYAGKIYGSYKNDEWKQCIVNKYTYKNSKKTYTKINEEVFNNPIKQNKWHILCLNEIYSYNYKNIILFSNNSELFVHGNNIMNLSKLFIYLDEQPDRKNYYNICDEIFYRILLNNHGNDNRVEKEHIESIQRKYGK